MSAPENYDAVVLGSGQAGTPLSIALAQSGMRTALIESKHVGGTCVNEGCTPTKTMIGSARVAYLARRAAEYGVHTGTVSVDFARVRERKRQMVATFRRGSETRVEKTAGLDLIFGHARFVAPSALKVRSSAGERELRAKHIFINTGTRAAHPKLDGIDTVETLDNASIMEVDALPEHLLVLGGGYIGLEFGQLFRRLGSRVTIVHSHDQLLTREDGDVAREIENILREDGVDVVLNAKATRVSRSGGSVRLETLQNGHAAAFTGSHLLLATGRAPNSDTLDLAAARVETDARGFIKVNERLETSAPGVFALGDIKGGPAFTHISYDDFRIVRANVLEKKNLSTADRLVPYTVFIDPQLGRVGLTESEARAQGIDVRVAKLPMSSVARALEVSETRGFMKAVVDAATARIVGAAILGIEGGEIMSAIEIAMMAKLPYTALRDGVFAHPTLVEALNNLFTAMEAGV